jgi:CHAT domain-containing protein/tetratricopeptide (TPR) repeat protein
MKPRCNVAVLVGLVLSPASARGTMEAPAPLVDGSVAERAMSGGAHLYRLRLNAGQFVRISVRQEGVDVALTLRGPVGESVAEADDPSLSLDGEERLAAIGERSGDYTLEVKAAGARAGRYALRVEELRDPRPMDCDRVEALRRLLEANRLCQKGVAPALREAAGANERVLVLCRRLADVSCEARALAGLGQVQLLLGNSRVSRDLYGEALSAASLSGEPYEQAEALTGLGACEDNLGQKKTALAYFRESLPLWRASGRRAGVATVLHDIALVQDNLGEKRAAADGYRQALILFRDSDDRLGEAASLNGLGKAADELGDYQRSLDAYEDALKIATELGNARGQAVILTNIGLVYLRLGAPERSLRYCEQALPLRRKVGDPRGEAATLTAMGKALADLGRTSEAIDLYEKALALSRGSSDPRGEAIALSRLAIVYETTGRVDDALEANDRSAEIRHRTGEALAESASLTRVGALRLRKGETEAARNALEKSLALAHSVGDRGQEAEDLTCLADLARHEGRLDDARSLLENAIALTEAVRRAMASPELRASYSTTVRRARELLVDTLLAIHRKDPSGGLDARAFEVVEQGRARSLFEVLSAPDAATPSGIDPALFERRREVRELLAAKLDRRLRLASSKAAAAELAEATDEVGRLETELDRLDARIRAGSPEYASLTGVEGTSLRDLQRLLGNDSVLLEYALGTERGFVWAVTSSSLVVRELPKRADVESAARDAYARLSSRETAADALARLERIVLAPVAGALRHKRILVVADGTLQYVPFSALPSPSDGRPLLAAHELVNLPSASVLVALRRETPSRKRPARTVVVFADPVFDADDARVAGAHGAKARAPEAPLSLVRSAADAGLASGGEVRLQRLPFTRREAERILALVPASQGRQAVDFAASRAAAMAPDVGDYRFVHFATHGLLDDRSPELSGLVLSLVDPDGKEQPGYLPASDVIALRLAADVVVLSGCQTALGKDVRGEGLVGLTRAFLYSGARTVVSSLWKVDDAATSELMSRFYAGMLGSKNLHPAAALRAAQASLRRDPRWNSPYFWAGFVLHGEWN